jgi:type IV pilus assembly protein PilN
VRIAINLASRPFADIAPALKKLRIAMGALVFAAIVLAIGLRAVHYKAEGVRERERALDTKVAQVRQEQQRYQALMRQPDNARTLQQAETLNRFFDEKSFSWTLAMEDLETVLPAGVQVTTLEPTVKNGLITVHLRVIGPRDRDVELVENLEHSRHFLMPRIVGESAESSGGPNQRVEPVSASSRVDFDVLADYAPGAAAERKHPKEAAEGQGEGSANTSAPAGPHRAPYTGVGRPHAPVQPQGGAPR